jgi:ACT domain-containing protein
MGKKQRQMAMLKALEGNMGIVSIAVTKVGISRQTHYDWINTDKKYADAVKELENVTLDIAEAYLFNLMKEKSPAAIIFYLKTKGKKRGYIERPETEVSIMNAIQVNPFEQLATNAIQLAAARAKNRSANGTEGHAAEPTIT